MKEHKKKFILSSVVVLLPILIGLFLWNRLPDTMAIHWGADGEANGFSNKAFAVFVPTIFLFLGHLVCCITTMADPGNRHQTPKAVGIIFWIMPILSLVVNGFSYAIALERKININLLMPVFLGLMFIFIGNYLPKIKQNYTLGIKVTWALQNEANWNATHRFGGRLWFFGGFLILFTIPLPPETMMTICIILIMILALAPMLYSYLFYRRQLQTDSYAADMTVAENPNKFSKIFSVVITVVTILLIGILLFTGDIRITYGSSSFQIEADYWPDSEVNYNSINSLKLRENDFDGGIRTNGFGSPRLAMGAFQNEEFGQYTRYTYGSCDTYVVLTSGDNIMVINGKTAEDTKLIYDTLTAKIAE